MALQKRYEPSESEPRWLAFWQANKVYDFSLESQKQVYSIDTPPATVSGKLHLGHVYSYSHPDFIARFWRMRGHNVFYPMGFDDNGLPTERLIEKRLSVTAAQIRRVAFTQKCLEYSQEAEKEYRSLWERLGLSLDWRFTYRTIDDHSRRTSQLSFIKLYHQARVYRQEAPAIWCPECQTSIAQAELNDLDRPTEFLTLAFQIESGEGLLLDGDRLKIATTRPELLPACVAVFVHPDDPRYLGLAGSHVRVPLFGQIVPVLADRGADPGKGTGAVMCCTFGDSADVGWWHAHNLPYIEALARDGTLTKAAGEFSGLMIKDARKEITAALDNAGLLVNRQPSLQSVRVHERCDTPVEYILVPQWFTRVLDARQALMEAGEKVSWHPPTMKARYQSWVENLTWDWCISRQRFFGVPFPVWYCQQCGEVILADEADLPVDPAVDAPYHPCPRCGGEKFLPEQDLLDTWATSSLSPQIVGRWLEDPGLYQKVFPFSLRPQAHEIIRTWAFYTIVKSQYHFEETPWRDVLISGWGIAGEGMGKISKSRGGGPMPPLEMIERYSGDAVRYWAASTGPGKDAIISEEKIQMGTRLVTKIWNVARFSERFIIDGPTPEQPAGLSPADRWILARLQRLVRRVTDLFETYDYAAAKSEIESFFWSELADNYIEMVKQRLYEPESPLSGAARFTLYILLHTVLKLFAPFLPFITEEVYQGLFRSETDDISIHLSRWPEPLLHLEDEPAEALGQTLVEIASAVRRYKSEHNLSLGTELELLQLASPDAERCRLLLEAEVDLKSITRARNIEVLNRLEPHIMPVLSNHSIEVAIYEASN